MIEADSSEFVYSAHTTSKAHTVVALLPGTAYKVCISCRALVSRDFAPPSHSRKKVASDERIVELYLPGTTILEHVTTLPVNFEFGCFFDDRLLASSWQLFYGTVVPSSGAFEQESTLSSLEERVRQQIVGSSAQPALAFTGISALELYAPRGLGCGSFIDINLQRSRHSIYEFQIACLQLRPTPAECQSVVSASSHYLPSCMRWTVILACGIHVSLTLGLYGFAKC